MADAVIFGGYSAVAWGTKPAGAYIIANIFRNLGLSSVVVDHIFAIPESFQIKIIEKYVDSDTKFICLSTTLLGTPGNIWTKIAECDDLFEPLMNLIKKIAPNAVFIIGGSKITRGEKTRLPFDFQIKGQAEVTIPAVVGNVLHDHKIFLDDQGYVTDKIYSYEDFNQSTLLSFTELDGVEPNETLPIEMARGCVFKCAFCEYNMTGKEFGDYTKTEDAFYRTLMSNYEKFGTTRYQFSDDTLNDSEEKINQLLDVSKKLPFQLEFGAYLRAELLEKYPDSAAKLLDAGLRGANFGLETLNRKSGLTVGKGYGMNAVTTLNNAKKVWKNDVAVNANIILGLPYDTVADIMLQQKILTEEEFVDNVFYTCLQIPRQGDSLFSEGLYKKYYKDLTPVPDFLLEKFGNEKVTLEFFEESIVWESEIMNVGDALILERELTADFMKKRPYIINNVNAFCSISLLEHLSMHELRTIKYIEAKDTLHEIAKKKVSRHIQFLLSNIQIPSSKHKLSIPYIPPSFTPFKPKIVIHNKTNLVETV